MPGQLQEPNPGIIAARFFERHLTHTKGVYARKPFDLYSWEAKIIQDVFGTVKSNGLRQYTKVYCEVPKKNGKTELAAGIALLGLFIDQEPGAEIYFVAAARDQAAIGFKVAAQMVRQNPELHALVKIVDSTKTIYLKDDPSCFMKAISADAGTNDGINPHIAVFDELHRQKNGDLYSVIEYGMDARSQPLMFCITTAGITGSSPICEQMHDYAKNIMAGIFNDPSFYPCIYGVEDFEDWTLEGHPENDDGPATGWWKANPSLGEHLNIERVRQAFQKALSNPAEQNNFRRLRLNQWVGQEVRYLPMDHWRACGEAFNPARFVGKSCVAGIDLAATQDITALVLLFMENDMFYLVPHFWIPADDLQKRSRADKVPYDLWVAQGLVQTTPGNQIDYKFLRRTIKDLGNLYDIREIAFDRWNATPVIQDLKETDGFNTVPIGQGYASMSAPTKELLRLVMLHRIQHNNNPVLNWMADNFSVKQDEADNVKPSKPDRRKTSKRIDGIAAGINALARLIVTPEYKASVYDDREIITI